MVAEHIRSAASWHDFPPASLPEVAFLGRSNVGKSSLLNALVGKKGLAYTSAKPGCTQLINFYLIDEKLRLVDLPGYGYAKVPLNVKAQWKGLIDSYLTQRDSLEMAVMLIDARRGWMEPDLELKQWLEHQNLPFVVVATKIDKLSRNEEYHGLAAMRAKAPDSPLVPFSAVTGRGVREIWQAISKTRTNRQP